MTEVEKLAFDLPDSQWDGAIAEALCRDAELEANPNTGTTLEQLDEQIELRRTDTALRRLCASLAYDERH